MTDNVQANTAESALTPKIGEARGSWTVLDISAPRGAIPMMLCRCTCGTTRPVSIYSLRDGSSTSCGCIRTQKAGRNLKNRTGQRFGKLVVVSKVKRDGDDKTYWNCKCDCGNSVVVSVCCLMSGNTKSCGCARSGRLIKLGFGLRGSSSKEYALWASAKERAEKRGIPFNIDASDLKIPNICPVLGIAISRDAKHKDSAPSLDRVIPSLGYVKGNVKVISFRANRLKSDASLHEVRLIECYLSKHLKG